MNPKLVPNIARLDTILKRERENRLINIYVKNINSIINRTIIITIITKLTGVRK